MRQWTSFFEKKLKISPSGPASFGWGKHMQKHARLWHVVVSLRKWRLFSEVFERNQNQSARGKSVQIYIEYDRFNQIYLDIGWEDELGIWQHTVTQKAPPQVRPTRGAYSLFLTMAPQ